MYFPISDWPTPASVRPRSSWHLRSIGFWRRRLSQTEAAQRLGINQPKISALSDYRLEGFSVERLMHFLNALGRDVEIVIRTKPPSRRTARITVTAA